jgi:hypothetical protein
MAEMPVPVSLAEPIRPAKLAPRVTPPARS